MKKIIYLLIIIFLISGCNYNYNTPSKKVEDLLKKYQNLDEKILRELDYKVDNYYLNNDQKVKYKGIIEKQYSNLDYEIINEIIDGNEAKVNVEIEVFNLDIASIRVNNDLEKDKSYFVDGNKNLDKDKYINYKLDIMENINERIKYQVEIGFEKQNKEWIMKELSTDTLRKIHGIYSSKL